MESYQLISQLKKLPKTNLQKKDYAGNYIKELDLLKNQDSILQASIFSGVIGYQWLNTRNIPDELFQAYDSSFTNSEVSLYQHYLEMLEKGDPSTIGFVSNMKGKFFEFYLQDSLNEQYPNYTFEIAENPIQPVWDIKGTNGEGEEILVQAKMWSANKAGELQDLINTNPEVLYATSSEIREKVLMNNPELEERFFPVDISNFGFTEDVKNALETLKDNFGLDLPDELFALAPYSTEIILGVRLILDLMYVNRDFSKVDMTEKSRIAGVKVLVLMSRFGVTTILTISASVAGTAVIPGIGTAVGGVGGAVTASLINKKISPYTLELVYKLLDLTPEDMFYYKNMEKINALAISFKKDRSDLLLI